MCSGSDDCLVLSVSHAQVYGIHLMTSLPTGTIGVKDGASPSLPLASSLPLSAYLPLCLALSLCLPLCLCFCLSRFLCLLSLSCSLALSWHLFLPLYPPLPSAPASVSCRSLHFAFLPGCRACHFRYTLHRNLAVCGSI